MALKYRTITIKCYKYSIEFFMYFCFVNIKFLGIKLHESVSFFPQTHTEALPLYLTGDFAQTLCMAPPASTEPILWGQPMLTTDRRMHRKRISSHSCNIFLNDQIAFLVAPLVQYTGATKAGYFYCCIGYRPIGLYCKLQV